MNVKRNKTGFTLLESMIAISMAAVLMMLGTISLSGLFNSSGTTEIKQKLSIAGNRIIKNLENGLTYQKIEKIDSGSTDDLGNPIYDTRSDCLMSGGSLSTDKVIVKDLFGQTQYHLVETSNDGVNDAYIASNSARISSTEVTVTYLRFSWICSPSKNDVLDVSFTLTLGNVSADFETQINMYNSF